MTCCFGPGTVSVAQTLSSTRSLSTDHFLGTSSPLSMTANFSRSSKWRRTKTSIHVDWKRHLFATSAAQER
ncbi:unnamed protein product [Symbiodinium natans]|uniref:Uncharacterized protein n=1 Tax=Symbiodinium natans TaxID=878477 RepID=A0A812SIG8_9DINO|nr:unnamed protein product [Symbiodinium natans]